MTECVVCHQMSLLGMMCVCADFLSVGWVILFLFFYLFYISYLLSVYCPFYRVCIVCQLRFIIIIIIVMTILWLHIFIWFYIFLNFLSVYCAFYHICSSSTIYYNTFCGDSLVVICSGGGLIFTFIDDMHAASFKHSLLSVVAEVCMWLCLRICMCTTVMHLGNWGR